MQPATSPLAPSGVPEEGRVLAAPLSPSGASEGRRASPKGERACYLLVVILDNLDNNFFLVGVVVIIIIYLTPA